MENKPGAGGTLGPGNMSRTAKPDGYTITQFPMSMLRMAHMQKTAWNPVTDFTYIIGVSGYTFGFTVRSDSPYKSFNEYIAAARKSPGKIEYGSTGIGSSPHLLMDCPLYSSDGAAHALTITPWRPPPTDHNTDDDL